MVCHIADTQVHIVLYLSCRETELITKVKPQDYWHMIIVHIRIVGASPFRRKSKIWKLISFCRSVLPVTALKDKRRIYVLPLSHGIKNMSSAYIRSYPGTCTSRRYLYPALAAYSKVHTPSP